MVRLKELFIYELYWYGRNIHGTTVLQSIIPTILSCIISMFISFDLFIDVPKNLASKPSLFAAFVGIDLCYLPLLLIMGGLRMILLSQDSDISPLWVKEMIGTTGKICTFLLRWLESGPLQIKLISVVMLLANSGDESTLGFKLGNSATLLIIITDFILTQFILFLKQSFMNPLFPDNHPRARIDGYTEQLNTLLLQICLSASFLNNILDLSIESANLLIFSTQLVCGLIGLGSFTSSLPFSNMETLLGYGSVIVIFYLSQIEYSLLSSEIDTFLILLILTVPLIIRMIEHYIRYIVLRATFIEQNNLESFRDLKLMLTRADIIDPKISFLRDGGNLQAHMSKCKNIGCICNDIWSSVLKCGEKCTLESMETTSRLISAHLLVRFMNSRRSDSYAIYIAIYWMLDNYKVPKYLFGFLEELKAFKSSFKDEFFYISIKKRICERLHVLYYSRELFYTDEKHKKLIGMWTDSDLRGITEIGVDLAYAIYYKGYIKVLTNMVFSFVRLNREYISQLRHRSSKMSDLNNKNSELHRFAQKIEKYFEFISRKALYSDYLHITPYYLFKSNIENMYSSAMELARSYRQKIAEKAIMYREILNMQTDINLLHNAIVFCAESCPSKLGLFKDVYGCVDQLFVSHEDIIGSKMDYLVMPGFIEYHTKSAINFAINEMVPLLGEPVRNSFIYLPKIDQIRPANYNLKLMPTLDSDYQLVVGVKLVRMTTKVFILIAPDDTISGFSINWSNIFPDMKEYLKPRIHIKELSPEIYRDILRKQKKKKIEDNILDAEEQKKDLAEAGLERAKNKDDMVNVFLNMESITSEETHTTNAGKLDSYYIINFVSDRTGEKVSYGFKVSITFHSYVLSDCRYKLLSLKLEDEKARRKLGKGNDTDSNISSLESIKIKPPSESADELIVINETMPTQQDIENVEASPNLRNPSQIHNYSMDCKFMAERTGFTTYLEDKKSKVDLLDPLPRSATGRNLAQEDNLEEDKLISQGTKSVSQNINSSNKFNMNSKLIEGVKKIKQNNIMEKFTRLFDDDARSMEQKANLATSRLVGVVDKRNKKKLTLFEESFRRTPLICQISSLIIFLIASLLAVFIFCVTTENLLQNNSVNFLSQGKMMFHLMRFEQFSLMFYSGILEKIAIEGDIFKNDR